MKDTEALDFLVEKFKTAAAVAAALGVSEQAFSNWRARSQISAIERPAVWAKVNDHGGNLTRDWLIQPAKRRRAA